MGYYNMPAAKLPPSSLSPTEQAVQAVGSTESLTIIHKLVYNACIQPKEDKFRRVKLTNPKIQAALVSTPSALEAMLALGWTKDNEEELVIPSGKYMTHAEVRILDAALERAKKAEKEVERMKTILATKS